MAKQVLSEEMRAGIVWLERQPGVTGVVQDRYVPSPKHKITPGSGKVVHANGTGVRVRVFDKSGSRDVMVHATPSPFRDRWLAAVAEGKPLATLPTVTERLRDAIQPKTGPDAKHVALPDTQVVKVAEETAQLVDVTPELATRWLEHNTRNRKLRQDTVNRYAADMKAGRWHVSPDAIAFDRNGAIVEGQHRLWAVLEANLTVRMYVMFGLNPDVIKVLGNGLTRSIADAANITTPGRKVSTMAAAVANMLLQSTIAAFAADKRAALKRITRQAQLDSLERHWEAIDFVVKECFGSATIRSITVASVMTPLARAYYTQDRMRLVAFGRALRTGIIEDNNRDKLAITLRNYLLRMQSGGARQASDIIYRKAERALQAFLEGESMATLYEATAELFPLPEEAKPRGRK